jgi:uncharacterized membrane protein (UPF0127 family)
MRDLTTILFLPISILLVFAGCGSGEKEQSSQSESRQSSEITLEYTRQVAFLESETDTAAVIDVAVANTKMEKNQGLMNVNNLPTNKGMLFIFDQEEPRSFWMANTPLPLDIIFINKELKIVRIHHSAQPYSEDNFKSGEPAKYVVETNGGFCINHDIREGMSVNF